MTNFRTWVSGFATAALILLAPIIGFAVVVTAEMLTDALARVGAPVVGPVAAVVAGCFLLRKYGLQARILQLRSGGA